MELFFEKFRLGVHWGGPPQRIHEIFDIFPCHSPWRDPQMELFFLKSSVWGSPGEDPQMELLFLTSSVWASPGKDPPNKFMIFSTYFLATDIALIRPYIVCMWS